jgi:hypothetical protein
MSILKKLFGEATPEWAKPIGRQEFKDFQSDVEGILIQRGMPANYDWNKGTAFIPSIEFNIAFHNLVEAWKVEPVNNRKIIAEAFLSGLLAQASESGSKVANCLDRLLIRIHDIDSVSHEVMVTEPIGSFLFQTLILDSETTTRTINPKSIVEEGLSASELLEIARKNLWSQVTPEINRDNGPFGRLTFIEADYFGASFISILDKFTEIGKLYWVSTPSRNLTLLAEPSGTGDDALMKFLTLAGKVSDSVGNQYLLPFVLEYKDGVFRDLCVRVEGGIEIAD